MASSSSYSSVILDSKYDVFLSFRGEDTRDSFTSHLYAALCGKKIQTFIDNDGLKRGDEISLVLLKAIEESRISVVIFSEHYASSKWCLDELVKILECKEMNGQMVIPVFYRVSPSDVRNQTGSLEDVFVKHEERFKEMIGKVQKWRNALTETANISGWDSMVIRPESKLVEEIVGDILKKLDATSAPSDCEGLVGIDARVEYIKSLLCIGSSDFRVIGIWGMGGIGKTTIAEVVFNQIRGQFEGCCFIGNVREESEKASNGLVRLKEQLLSKILGEVNLNIGTLNAIPTSLKHRIQHTKILVVLDDVSNSEQLKILNGGIDQFGHGSRVIITTRDKQVLCNYEEADIYEVKELNYQQAFKLFSTYAFKQSLPPNDLVMLSWKIINYAKGNPLALKVLGSSLYNKHKQVWESAFNKLRRIPNPEIHNALRISYNMLDREEQNLFLDIACFFKGEVSDHAIKILDCCYLSAYAGLDALIDKSLMTISIFNRIEMHDLLQEMGREIVYKEDLKDPSKRSRLWNHEDIYPVLKKNTGTDKVEAIFLDMSTIKDVHLSPRVFADMENLKFLKFYKPQSFRDTVHLPKGLKYLPDKLSYLHWDGYPSKTLAPKFSAENLVILDLPYSNLELLWKETKHTSKLRSINLDYSRHLTEIPNLSYAPQLQIINLQNCESLLEIPSSIQSLHNLCVLNLNGCKSLRNFPHNIHFKSLGTLDLSGCINLKEFPNILGHIEDLRLRLTAIEEIPSSIQFLDHLRNLDLMGCESLRNFPSNIHFKSLGTLRLSGCINLAEFPNVSGDIKYLYLDGTSIEEIPSSIKCLTKLRELDLKNCTSLKSLPTSICMLKDLNTLYLSNCSKLEHFPEIMESMEHLEYLQLNGTAIKELPSSIGNLKGLKDLNLRGCKNFDLSGCLKLEELPKNLGSSMSLERIHAGETSVSQLPSSTSANCNTVQYLECLGFTGSGSFPLSGLCYLRWLTLSYCNIMRIPEDLCSLSSLTWLDLRGNKFQSLPTCLNQLSDLGYLYLSNCDMLQSIPELPLSLRVLEASNCKQLQSLTVPSSWLEEFDAANPEVLTYIFNPMDLTFTNCMQLHQVSELMQHMAIASLKHCSEKSVTTRPRISLCLPGSEIPDWFSYRNSGCWITFQLPQFWCNRSFIGFAVCAVIASEGSQFGHWKINCSYYFETDDADSYHFINDFTIGYLSGEVSINSEHILIGYDSHLIGYKGDRTEALFKFEFLEFIETRENYVKPESTPCYKVKYCGVCPLYIYNSDANMTQPAFLQTDLLELKKR